MDLLLATHNTNKTREFRELLGHDFEVIDLASFPEIVIPGETGRTFEENASLKAIAASHNRLVVADDSGLEVAALGGAPGIYSARYRAKTQVTVKMSRSCFVNYLRETSPPTSDRPASGA